MIIKVYHKAFDFSSLFDTIHIMPNILDGRKIAGKIKKRLAVQVKRLKNKPAMAVVYAGSDPASLSYIMAKEKAAKEIGVDFLFYKFPARVSEKKVFSLISGLNQNEKVSGIIVQLPLPAHLPKKDILNAIALEKDVDVLSDKARELFSSGKSVFISPPAGAVLEFLKTAKRPLEKSTVVVVGRGMLVGEPVAMLLKQRVKRLIICDRKTKDLSIETKKADILISAVGKPNLIKKEMVKKEAVVIDAGTAKYKGKIVGDVDFEAVAPKVSYITPVPGGVGPVTVAMLLANAVKAAKKAV